MPRARTRKPAPSAAPDAAAMPGWAKLQPAAKGTISELLVAAWLAGHGLEVWQPLSACSRSDLAVAAGSRLLRLQIRTATRVGTRSAWRVCWRRIGRDGRCVPYRRSEVDYFIVVPAYYVVPASATVGRFSATLAPGRTKPLRRNWIDWEQYRGAAHLLRGAN
jgi:hypothetical protein